MKTPRPKLQRSPQQPNLQLEMFPETAATPAPASIPRSRTAVVGPSVACGPEEVWRTLEEPDKRRIGSSWTKVMWEVANDSSDS